MLSHRFHDMTKGWQQAMISCNLTASIIGSTGLIDCANAYDAALKA